MPQVDQDLEYWIFKITDHVRNDLNIRINNVNTLKGKTDTLDAPQGIGLTKAIVLKTIPEDGFFWASTGSTIPNTDPAVIFSAEIVPGESAKSEGIDLVQIAIAILVSDNLEADSQLLNRRLLRYRRALRYSLGQVALQNTLQGYRRINVPNDLFKIQEQNFWAVPVVVEFGIAGY